MSQSVCLNKRLWPTKGTNLTIRQKVRTNFRLSTHHNKTSRAILPAASNSRSPQLLSCKTLNLNLPKRDQIAPRGGAILPAAYNSSPKSQFFSCHQPLELQSTQYTLFCTIRAFEGKLGFECARKKLGFTAHKRPAMTRDLSFSRTVHHWWDCRYRANELRKICSERLRVTLQRVPDCPSPCPCPEDSTTRRSLSVRNPQPSCP